jgi:DnaK suppressor protein
MLNNTQRKAIKEKILTEIASTTILIEKYKEHTKPTAPDCAIGRVSRMDAIINTSVAKVSLGSAEQKLKKLTIALEKVTHKNFGVCTRCEREIQLGRLLFMPESNRCVHCSR